MRKCKYCGGKKHRFQAEEMYCRERIRMAAKDKNRDLAYRNITFKGIPLQQTIQDVGNMRYQIMEDVNRPVQRVIQPQLWIDWDMLRGISGAPPETDITETEFDA